MRFLTSIGLINRFNLLSSGVNITEQTRYYKQNEAEVFCTCRCPGWREKLTFSRNCMEHSLKSGSPPAEQNTHTQKYNYRNSCCIIQQTGSNHISCVARTASWEERIISPSRSNMILTERVRARHTLMHRIIKRKNTILAVNLSD